MTPTPNLTVAAAAIALTCLAAAGAHAATTSYAAILTELNGSGVSGRINFTLDDEAQTLRARANVSGLAAGLPHVNHIHGRFRDDYVPGGSNIARNSVVPTAADDLDGDGLVEVLEAAGSYGDVLLSLENPAPTMSSFHNGPVADADGNVIYDYMFSLAGGADDPFFSTVGGPDYEASDAFPLDMREYVIHGAYVAGDTLNEGFSFVPGTERENGTGYSATLPVAAAEIQAVNAPAPVPVPAGAFLLLTGLGGLGLAGRRRKAS